MDDLSNESTLLALAVLEFFPESVRESLISDSGFRSRYGLKTDAQISFGKSAVSVRRSEFFKCIRGAFADSQASLVLKDATGEEWQVKLIKIDNKCYIEITRSGRRFLFFDYWALSADTAERVSCFDREISDLNLPEKETKEWRNILATRPLLDDELDTLHKFFLETPIRVAAAVVSQISEGESEFSSLVPRSERYFVRLAGECKESTNISEYVDAGLREHMQQLVSWRVYDGFLLALLLSSHPFNSAAINISQLSDENLVKAYEWLQDHGDRFSQIGAIEIGLSIFDKRPAITPYLNTLIGQIRDDNPDDDHGRLKLLSSLIVLVDGELSRTKTLSGKPPFWRRLASIAQASIIERGIVGANVDIAKFSKAALQARGQIFYLQTLSDLRREPRWYPEYVSSRQLKAEFIGRIIGAAKLNAGKVEGSELHELLNEGPEGIQSLIDFPFPYMPGPLEGGLEWQIEPPPEMVTAMEEGLSADVLHPNSFAALVNSALIFRLDSHQAELAVKALRSVKHHLSQATNGSQLFSVLSGLATVAAVTRSSGLAEELKILTRRCRLRPGAHITADEALYIGLVAAAAYPELTDWCKFVGDWATELAFQSLRTDEIETLQSHLKHLCHIVPKLWHACGRANAALNVALGTQANF